MKRLGTLCALRPTLALAMIVHLLLIIPAVVFGARKCDPPTRKYFVSLGYNQFSDENGQYPNGTTVYASCRGGTIIREGADKSMCFDGHWAPELGRCPYHCSMKEFTEKRGYSDAEGYKPEPYPKVDLDIKWRVHGTGAYAYCIHRTPWGVYINEWHYWECNDGGWLSSYPKNIEECK